MTAIGAGIRVTRFEPLGDGESYLLGFAAATRPAFTAAVSALRSLPPWQRAWIPEEGIWWISVDALTLLARSIPELKPHIEYMAHRPPDIAEAMGAYVRPSLRRSRISLVPPGVRAAFHVLALPPDAPASAVRAAFRHLAKTTHPDVGGTQTAMVALHAAYTTALAWAERSQVTDDARTSVNMQQP